MSNAGKSVLVGKLVEHYHPRFSTIVICGVDTHPLQEQAYLRGKLVVSKEIVNPANYKTRPSDRILFILDDLLTAACNSDTVADAFTRGRHENLSVIYIVQNMFFHGKHSRNISLNASHFVLMNQRDLGQIECLGRQIFGKGNKLVDLYKTVVRGRPHGYLLIDLSSNVRDALQFRSNILREFYPYELVYEQ